MKDKFLASILFFSFKDIFIVCDLGNELIICIYRLHTKSIFLVIFFYLGGRHFQTAKVTIHWYCNFDSLKTSSPKVDEISLERLI